MKVTIATRHFAQPIGELFSKVSDEVVIMPKYYRDMNKPFSTDLLVFSGGEDVNPQLYGSSYRTFYTQERDEFEMGLLSDISWNNVHAKKVLGICRGLQIINVFRGGTLITDLQEHFGKDHDSVHPIIDCSSFTGIPNPFAGIKTVNSLHHQGIHRGGQGMKVFSKEPSTNLPEIVMWDNKHMGMQFHPEFFDNSNEYKWEIADIVAKWVDGEEFLPSKSPRKLRGTISTSTVEYLEQLSTLESHLDGFITSSVDSEE